MTMPIERLINLFFACCTVAIRDLTTAVEEHTAIEQGLDGTLDEFGRSDRSAYAEESGLQTAREQLGRAAAAVLTARRKHDEDASGALGPAWAAVGPAWVMAISGLHSLGRPTVPHHENYAGFAVLARSSPADPKALTPSPIPTTAPVGAHGVCYMTEQQQLAETETAAKATLDMALVTLDSADNAYFKAYTAFVTADTVASHARAAATAADTALKAAIAALDETDATRTAAFNGRVAATTAYREAVDVRWAAAWNAALSGIQALAADRREATAAAVTAFRAKWSC